MQSVVILLSCPDQPGIVARFTGILFETGANILNLEQHVENGGLFFMRIHADTTNIEAEGTKVPVRLERLAKELGGTVSVHDTGYIQRVALLVSSEEGFLHDFYMRQKDADVPFEIPAVISNKADLSETAGLLNLPFHHVPNDDTDRRQAEQEMTRILTAADVDLVVLARYMKVLSEEFVAPWEGQMINIHHSFLPAFKGNKPYHQAWERGVKVIGATSHYVIPELDAGPIIAQDVLPVTHRHSAEEMAGAGREVERRILWRAVRAHLQHRVITHGNRTIVFHG